MSSNRKTLQVPPKLGILVFGLVALINNDDVVATLGEVDHLTGHHAVGGYQNTTLFTNVFHLLYTILPLFIVELYNVVCAVISPLFKLILPIVLQSTRHNNQHLLDHVGIKQTLKVHRHLHRLSQTHVIT